MSVQDQVIQITELKNRLKSVTDTDSILYSRLTALIQVLTKQLSLDILSEEMNKALETGVYYPKHSTELNGIRYELKEAGKDTIQLDYYTLNVYSHSNNYTFTQLTEVFKYEINNILTDLLNGNGNDTRTLERNCYKWIR